MGVRSSLSYLGGSVQENGDQFLVTQGTNNVNFAFNANFKGDDKYQAGRTDEIRGLRNY